jgi:hypothetical protein
MAATKKAGAGTKAGAGARKGTTKANGVAKDAKSRPTAHGSAAPKKKPAAVKLNDRQREFLKKIHDAGEAGYHVGAKVEQRTIDALAERHLVKRGPKDAATGHHRYLLTKAAGKHLPAAPAPAPAPAVEAAPAAPSAPAPTP